MSPHRINKEICNRNQMNQEEQSSEKNTNQVKNRQYKKFTSKQIEAQSQLFKKISKVLYSENFDLSHGVNTMENNVQSIGM